jgi:hypothetical protein
MRAVLGAVLVLAVTAAACGGGSEQLGVEDAGSIPADYSYEIPAGAGDAFDRGEPLEILPGEMRVSVGEVIEIVNQDGRGHLVGPFYVGAGETLRQRFASPGEFIGVCTVHPSGRLALRVEP